MLLIYNPSVPPIEEASTIPRTTQQIIIIIFFYVTQNNSMKQEGGKREKKRKTKELANRMLGKMREGLTFKEGCRVCF